MKSLIVGIVFGTLLIAGFLTTIGTTKASPVDDPIAREYSMELPTGTEMKVGINATELAVSYLMPDNTGLIYSATVTGPTGQFSLPLSRAYNGATGKTVIDVEVISAGAGTAVIKIGTGSRATTYTLTEDAEATEMYRPGPCSNPSGTGVCDQVSTNREWWSCFRCCFFLRYYCTN